MSLENFTESTFFTFFPPALATGGGDHWGGRPWAQGGDHRGGPRFDSDNM